MVSRPTSGTDGMLTETTVGRSVDPGSMWSWVVYLFINPLFKAIGIGEEVSGQRHLFQSTSAMFGGKGIRWTGKPGINTLEKQDGALFLAGYKCDCYPTTKVMASLRKTTQPKVWNHTQEVLQPYMGSGQG
jgi:hypothetical protein